MTMSYSFGFSPWRQRAGRALVALATLAWAGPAGGASLVDTGPAGPPGGSSVFNNVGTNGYFQNLAGKFTLGSAATVSAFEWWLSYQSGGQLLAKVYSDGGNIPGSAIYQELYTVPTDYGPSHWQVFGGLSWDLPAGSYWVTLEPPANSTLNASAPNGAAAPLAAYAYDSDGNNGWLQNPATSWGVRVDGAATTILPFGAVTGAIDNDTFTGVDTYSATFENLSTPEADSSESETQAGLASSRGAVPTGTSQPAGTVSIPPVDVGALASASGEGRAGARGLAFRTWQFTGTTSQLVTYQATLNGSFVPAPGGLPTGDVHLYAEVSVIRGNAFVASLPGSGQSLADFFFAVPNAHTSMVDPENLVFRNGTFFSVAASYGSAVLARTTVSLDPSSGSGVSQPVTAAFTATPGQLVTVIADIAAYSNVTCLSDGTCGAAEASFYDSLKSNAMPFVDSNGNPVNTFSTDAPPPASPVPAFPRSLAVLAMAAALAACGATRTSRSSAKPVRRFMPGILSRSHSSLGRPR
jgi:hypothetical protein